MSHNNNPELLEFKLKQIDTALGLEYDLARVHDLFKERLLTLAELMRYRS